MRNNEVIEISNQYHHESSTNQENTVIEYSPIPNSNSNDFLSEKICCIKCKNPINNREIVKVINNQIYCHKECFDYIERIINKIKEIPYNTENEIINNKKKNQEFPITFDLRDYELVLEIKKK